MNNVNAPAGWRSAGSLFLLLLLLVFFLYQQTVLYLVGKWNQLESGSYGHGYLVLLISAYLIYTDRRRLLSLVPCPEYRALPMVFAASMLWLVAALVDVEMIQAIGLLLLILSLIWALLGTRVMQVLMFPVMYIGFALPVWDPLSPFLQELTADVVFWVVRILEIPALRIENSIVLSAGKLSVEETCSGLRYVLAALTIGALYARLNYRTFAAGVAVVMVFVVTAVLANILRVFILVYLAYKTDMQHPLINDHISFGWYLFAGLIVVLFVVIGPLLHRNIAIGSDAVPDRAENEPTSCDKGRSQYAFLIIMAVMVSAGPGMIFWMGSKQQYDSASSVPIVVPLSVGAWQGVAEDNDDWQPQFRGAVSHRFIYNDNNGHTVYLYIGEYPEQKQGEELIYYANRISDNEIWRMEYQKAKQQNAGGRKVLEQRLVKKDGSQRLVWYWYHIAGQNTINRYQAKILQVLGLVTNRRSAAVIAIAVKLDNEPENARKVLRKLVEEVGPAVSQAVDGNK